jgi:hypothetical protein
MKDMKQRIPKEKDQTTIYMQRTQGLKPSISSPNIGQKLKSRTFIDKENHQPNMSTRYSKPLIENSFGAAKLQIRQSSNNLTSDNLHTIMNKSVS